MLNLTEFLSEFCSIKVTRNREPKIGWGYIDRLSGNVTIKHMVRIHSICWIELNWFYSLYMIFTQVNMAIFIIDIA